MKSKGGAGPYRKGAAFERECQKDLDSKGFLVVRQPKSQSPFDLLATRRTLRLLIQCKTNGKLPKKEREALLLLCEQHYYTPILAYKEKGIQYKHLEGNGDSYNP
jgi:Holliday junction resolvase